MAGRVKLAAAAIGLAAATAAMTVEPPARPAIPDGDWHSYGRGWTEDHFSPLTEINDRTVSRLGLAWSHDIDPTPSVLTQPVAADGVLYTAIGYSVIHAFDGATGKLLWRYDPEVGKVAGIKLRAGWGPRGIAYHDGTVFTATLEGRLIALDAKTGKPRWSVQTIDDPENALYITGPPYIVGDLVLIGNGGAEYGPVRGYVSAYDRRTGKLAWRFYTVPGKPGVKDGAASDEVMEKAASTWTGEWWKHGGGGTVWQAMAYDPQLGRVYIGTGNGSPWNQRIRSPGGGDNLFLASILALDAKTGRYIWHYQANPGENWDYNNTMDIQLTDLVIGGQRRPVLLHAPKNGFFYVIDRETGKLLGAEAFGKQTWAERIDLASGRPVEKLDARYPGGKPVLIFPGPYGAHGVATMSYSPATGLAYIPTTEAGNIYVDPPGDLPSWRHLPQLALSTGTGAPPPDMAVPPPTSALVAWDPVAQKPRWTVPTAGRLQGGTMATAGNLLFQGRSTGRFIAYAADTGRELWSFDAQTGIQASPVTYTAKGRQYVAILAGWRGSPNGDGTVWDYRTQPRRLLAFALGGARKLPPYDPGSLDPVDDPDFRLDPAKVAIGRAVYGTRCTVCHGAGVVAGGGAPDLRRAPGPMDLEAFTAIVSGGVLQEAGMPRFQDLSPAQIEGLQHFIRSRARESLAAAHQQGRQP
ncbi:MAG: PQQ-dependent dehydrogenase, methanol/ethanol family [Alphaproteobacteria bacterium]|nr:PQQ-dependent dehydrogenase, methanol/ethanol family [Alphaproteobacteria bacterium]